MFKLPQDPDQFKYFRGDPPEIKLEAWKRMQLRLAIRDLTICIAFIAIPIVSIIIKFFR